MSFIRPCCRFQSRDGPSPVRPAAAAAGFGARRRRARPRRCASTPPHPRPQETPATSKIPSAGDSSPSPAIMRV